MTGKIGITERGDAGLDLSWVEKLPLVDGTILITKNLRPAFRQAALAAMRETPLVVHVGCTGLGSLPMEPHVPAPSQQLDWLEAFIDEGFPVENLVLRIDPIIPVPRGLMRARAVLDEMLRRDIPVTRVRFSVYDEYKHARQRLIDNGFKPIYPKGNFQCSEEQKLAVVEMLAKYPFTFESCAEDWAEAMADDWADAHAGSFETRGCISEKDLAIMGLKPEDYGAGRNIQGRNGCHCLACKTELLNCRHQCPHGCLYCYWKD